MYIYIYMYVCIYIYTLWCTYFSHSFQMKPWSEPACAASLWRAALKLSPFALSWCPWMYPCNRDTVNSGKGWPLRFFMYFMRLEFVGRLAWVNPNPEPDRSPAHPWNLGHGAGEHAPHVQPTLRERERERSRHIFPCTYTYMYICIYLFIYLFIYV